jgi:hypothetical protein
MSPVAYRLVVALLWALVVYDSIECRGLFWDGASFLVNVIDSRDFHDFYPARAHVGWVTQLPVLIALQLGVTDTHALAVLYSAALFALPAGLYHLALARVRHDPVSAAVVLVAIALVYLPTSFFIIGEYSAAYGAVIAAMAVLLTSDRRRLRDALVVLALAVLCLRSYEAMVYLGPLLAAAVMWWSATMPRDATAARLAAWLAALAFVGSALVAGGTIAVYWAHPHFVLVRAAILDFWQNLQFVVPAAGLALVAFVSLVLPSWLRGWIPAGLIILTSVALVCTLWFRQWIGPDSMVFPPAHYVARTAAGCLLWAMLVFMWIHTVWRRTAPALLRILREAAVGRRLVAALTILVVAAAIPDVVMTRLWGGYLDYLKGVLAGPAKIVHASDLPHEQWPYRLFSQDWTAPALGALLRGGPDQAVLLGPEGAEPMPFDSRCGTLPRLKGYSWRS